jgi:hypothetical protein
MRSPPWSSCSETTSGSPSRAARIARAAAWPPESVVMHGIPRATAARRISQPSCARPEPVGVLITRSTVAALDPVDDVRRALADLVERRHGHPHPLDRLRRAARRDDPKPRSCS